MMKKHSTTLIFMVVILITTCLMSCGDDDTIAVNLPPTIEAQSFTTSESVDDVTVIGTVQASDPEEESLTFRITEDIDELFEMTEQGAISLEAGKTLDFETKFSHQLVVAASDGNEETTATITINVVDENENVAPTIIDQAFEVAENIADTEVIGRVVASDTNGDALTFTLENDADELFEISNEGDLSLIATKTLDFDTKTTHSLIIQVSDGIASASATISISVTNVADLPFVTTWEVTDTDLSIFIPTPIGDGGEDQLVYDYHVDWGDGSSDGNANGDIGHTYATAGTYTVSITGKFPRFRMDEADENGEVDDEDGIERAAPLDGSGPNAPKLKTIEAWGEIEWESFEGAFVDCINLTYNATDVPNLEKVEILAGAFAFCEKFNGDISDWDVSNVTNMNSLFSGAQAFNQDISNWNVSKVTDMARMFSNANRFNQNIGGWDVSNVTNMSGMFRSATSFDQDISNWDVSSVTNMTNMFLNNSTFNQPLDWGDKTRNVLDMSGMFWRATAFNQDIGGWDVSSVTDMELMFREAKSFNQDIDGWNVTNVKSMWQMFNSAEKFNQNIGSWDVSNVTNMNTMFASALAFNQDISDWEVGSVTDMGAMFDGATSFSQDLADWDVANVTNCLRFSRNSGGPAVPTAFTCVLN